MPPSTSSARIVGLSRANSGKTFPLGLSTSGFNYQNLFEVRPMQGFYVLRAGPTTPVIVSGRTVTECVLEDGDVIIVDRDEFEFRMNAGGLLEFFEKITPWRVMIPAFVIFAALTYGMIFLVSRMASPLSALVDFHQNAPQPGALNSADGTPVTLSQRIGIARAQFVIAERLYNEHRLQDNNLSRAIQIWDSIPASMEDLKPKPEVAIEAEHRAKEAREKLRLKMIDLKDAAKNSFQAGRMEDVLTLLTQMLATQPEPQDPERIWAMEMFLKYSK